MKKSLPTPAQAKRLIIIGGVLLAASLVLREGVSDVALGVGAVLLLMGVLCNGIGALLGVAGKADPSRRE